MKAVKVTTLKRFVNQYKLAMTVVGVACIGLLLTFLSKAATANVSVEAENGTIVGSASTVNDSSASGGKAVKFTDGSSNTGGGGSSSGSIKNVFIIMMENTNWSQVKGSANFPWLNSTLLPQSSYATNYRTGGVHPSLPNYLTLEGGDSFGITDQLPTTTTLTTTDHLTTYLNKAGLSWKYYAENLPGNGTTCNLSDPGAPYSEDHNVYVYFGDVKNNQSYCISHERPYDELLTDLSAGKAPSYSFIVPNDYDQGEKPAPGSNCPGCQADKWLKTNVPKIQASQQYKDGGLILVLWDESAPRTDNPIGAIAVSQFAKKGHADTQALSHCSTLRSMQEIFHLTPLLRCAQGATDLQDMLTVPLGG